MHLLYVDESGHYGDASQTYFVLAGVALFERQCFWVSSELDKIAERINPADPASVEFHGSPMYGGKKFWRRFSREERYQLIKEVLAVLSDSVPSNRLFGCVVNKAALSPGDPVEIAFEQLASRFDHYLSRLHKQGDPQCGIIISDESTYENTLQGLATNFRTIGHTWGKIRNLAEVPLFLDSRASRLIQLADLVAYSMFGNYEYGDDQFYAIINNRFDQVEGIKHGLYERL